MPFISNIIWEEIISLLYCDHRSTALAVVLLPISDRMHIMYYSDYSGYRRIHYRPLTKLCPLTAQATSGHQRLLADRPF